MFCGFPIENIKKYVQNRTKMGFKMIWLKWAGKNGLNRDPRSVESQKTTWGPDLAKMVSWLKWSKTGTHVKRD